MKKNDYEKLEGMLCHALEDIIAKGDLSASSLDNIDKLTRALKNTKRVTMMDEEEGEYSSRRGYSGDGEWSARGNYSRDGYRYSRDGGSYDDGDSYRGRRRDSMGRYSRDGETDMMMRKLEEMESSANERDKDAIRKVMDRMRDM